MCGYAFSELEFRFQNETTFEYSRIECVAKEKNDKPSHHHALCGT